jgi:protein translocase SecG subunit
MALFIGFLTFILVMNCLLLMLLVLIQLPKKEAGAGIAFGGGTTDALFGAGSGNALTNLTKYSAGLFMVLALLLSYLNVHNARRSARTVEELLTSAPKTTPAATTAVKPTANTAPLTAGTNQLLTQPPTATNQLLTLPAPSTTIPRPAAPAKTNK